MMETTNRNQARMPAEAPRLEWLCRITARVAPVVSLGEAPGGERRYVPIVGGTVEGPQLHGEVLSGGVDWQLQRRDGTLDIEAHYVLKTADGALIEVQSRGYRHGPPEVMARMARGEAVAPDAYYFHTALSFCTGSPAWARLNSLLAVAKARREPGAAVLEVYLVGGAGA
jgi:hypothetical protein